jgi:hypothetical protein
MLNAAVVNIRDSIFSLSKRQSSLTRISGLISGLGVITTLFLGDLSLPVFSRPQGVPPQACSEISNLRPGTLCYVLHDSLGGKANAHGSPIRGDLTLQAQSGFYVVDSTLIEETSRAGNGTVSKRVLAIGATVDISEGYARKLEEINRIVNELDARISGNFGPLAVEARNKLTVLRQKRDEYNSFSSIAISAGRNAPTTSFSWSASSRSCGTFGVDTCGSWVEFRVYEVRRYLGDPVAEYNRIFFPALMEARNAVSEATNPSTPGTSPGGNPQPPFPQPNPIPPQGGGLPPGHTMSTCGCWGPNPPPFANEPRCASGGVQVLVCPALNFCAPGHPQYGWVCR